MHNYGFVLQTLRDVAPRVVEFIKEDTTTFDPTSFPGAYMHGAYVYYRYILKEMNHEPSDTPDIHQVFYIPYCAEVIVEKSMAGILHQLQEERSLIPEVKINSIRRIREVTG
jgi:hypothetical protein